MQTKRSGRETIKRYCLCVVGLFFSALGVAVTKLADLGVSPISSVANVMSMKIPVLSLGNWLILWNCVLILGQILILRRRFQPVQLMQVPLSFLFGYFTDFGMWLFSWAVWDFYPMRLVNIAAGTFLLGFGIALCVIADAMSRRFPTPRAANSAISRSDLTSAVSFWRRCCRCSALTGRFGVSARAR